MGKQSHLQTLGVLGDLERVMAKGCVSDKRLVR